MARKFQVKTTSGDGLATPTNANNKFVHAALYRVATTGEIQDSESSSTFFLNPDSIEDSKTANWVENNIPGQSDPILQWVSSGARNLNFTALVTRDTVHISSKAANPVGDLIDSAINAIGGIASKFAGVNIPPLGSALEQLFGTQTTSDGEDLTIAPILDYYRSLLYPSIDEAGILQSSPPLLVMAIGKSLSSFDGKNVSGRISPDSTDLWVAKSVNIRITKWLPNLTPMEAEVTFNLVQYTMKSRSSSSFGITDVSPQSSNILENPLSGLGLT